MNTKLDLMDYSNGNVFLCWQGIYIWLQRWRRIGSESWWRGRVYVTRQGWTKRKNCNGVSRRQSHGGTVCFWSCLHLGNIQGEANITNNRWLPLWWSRLGCASFSSVPTDVSFIIINFWTRGFWIFHYASLSIILCASLWTFSDTIILILLELIFNFQK